MRPIAIPAIAPCETGGDELVVVVDWRGNRVGRMDDVGGMV